MRIFKDILEGQEVLSGHVKSMEELKQGSYLPDGQQVSK